MKVLEGTGRSVGKQMVQAVCYGPSRSLRFSHRLKSTELTSRACDHVVLSTCSTVIAVGFHIVRLELKTYSAGALTS